MNKKVKILLISYLIFAALFVVFALFVFIYGIAYMINKKDTSDFLAVLYCFFHLLITIFGLYFSIKSMKNGSLIMRTLMYKNDDVGFTVSKPAKIICLSLGGVSLFIFIYFLLSFVFKDVKIFMWDYNPPFKFMMLEVFAYLFVTFIHFYLFPSLYDIQVDIDKRRAKYNKK